MYLFIFHGRHEVAGKLMCLKVNLHTMYKKAQKQMMMKKDEKKMRQNQTIIKNKFPVETGNFFNPKPLKNMSNVVEYETQNNFF